ncbi:MAG: tetratricopeptide repeat protein [Acidobacteriota bacterium]|nr:tetratricopeptide repeat protein [Acidobacteriota bacterium]
MRPKRFRIAFSFAGEKRDFVEQVAAILAQRFGKERILYDKFHQGEFSRSDLAFYLPDLYEGDADLVVAVFCPDYENKEWCGLEWNAIFGLLKKRNVSEVMLTRFERVEGKGLRGLAGYTDLDELTPEQAASVILERLAANEGKPKDYYTQPSSHDGAAQHTSIPNNLPRLQPFFGREAELAQIREALDADNRTWGALIDGPGGMGKTSLAVRAAYDCPPEQFRRIVFVSVKDRELDDDGVRELGVFILPGFLEMLNELSRELGRPEITKAPEDQRIALYEQTAGKPLLLRWVAGQLGRGSCRTFTDALEFLRSCPEDNDPLEFVFGDLVNEFTEAETKVLCALTYFSLPAKVEHLAAVAGCDEEAAETALRSLANRSLVVPDTEEKAFALVPMVADFLRRRKPEVVAETGDRLEKRAYALVLENGYKKFDNFPVLDAAWPTVAAALPRFLAGPNDRLQTVCSAFQYFLNFTGRWDEWLALSRDAEVKAVAAKDFRNAGWRAYQAGWVHYLRGQSAEVLACADRAEHHFREAQASTRDRAFAIRLRGVGHQLAGDYPAAIAAYRDAVELWRTLSIESDDVADGLNDLAEVELLSGELADAERDFREALRIALAVDYREGIAYITGNLSTLALAREDWPGAEALAREALLLAEKVGRKELIASNCLRLAMALARQGRKPEALPHARRAVEIFTALRSPDLEAARETLAACES